MAPIGLIREEELPANWGLLECAGKRVQLRVMSPERSQRSSAGLKYEMNLDTAFELVACIGMEGV